jgi:hypothetical protein
MMTALKDPRIIVGILAIINAIVIAVIFHWWRNRKALSYEVISDVPLFSIRQEIKHRVEVMLDGNSVGNVHLVIVKIINDGRVPIEDKDFVVPITIKVDENSELLTPEITKTIPTDLPAKLVKDDKSVRIEPLMLNRGDSITVQVLASELSTPINITGRIKGIPQLKRHNTLEGFGGYLYKGLKLYSPELLLLLIVFIVSAISAVLLSLERLGDVRYILAAIPIVLFFVGFIYMNYRTGQNSSRQ